MGATAGFVEHSGSAIGTGRQALEDLKEEMRQAGAELLVLQPGQMTATQVGTENAVGMCALQRIVEACEDAFDSALKFFGKWIGVEEVGKVTLFKDFGAATLAEASAQLLITQNQAGKLSDVTTLTELKRRGILAADVDVEEELSRIEEQGPPLGTVGADGMPAGGDMQAPGDQLQNKPEGTEKPEPVDLTPVLDAIASIKVAEKTEPAEAATVDLQPIISAIEAVKQQIAEVAAKVDEPTEAEMDFTPIETAIAAVSAKVDAMEKDDPQEAQRLDAIEKAVSQLATKQEANNVNSELLRYQIKEDVLAAISKMQTVQPPEKVVPINKQIQFINDADGNIIGAKVTGEEVQFIKDGDGNIVGADVNGKSAAA